jgi:hypothetical protein
VLWRREWDYSARVAGKGLARNALIALGCLIGFRPIWSQMSQQSWRFSLVEITSRGESSRPLFGELLRCLALTHKSLRRAIRFGGMRCHGDLLRVVLGPGY